MKYSKEMLENAARTSTSIAEVMRNLGIRRAGGSHSHLSRRLKFFAIDISHFTGKTSSKGRPQKRKTWKEILILRSEGRRTAAYQLRRALIESGVKYVCSECGLPPFWNGKELVIPVDHQNGNWLDDRPNNVRFLCPNCHTQTPGYSGRKRPCG